MKLGEGKYERMTCCSLFYAATEKERIVGVPPLPHCFQFSVQANNQWNIAAELADDPMDSAFARALRGGIKGVAMVLDHEVQPLTRASTAHRSRQPSCMWHKFHRRCSTTNQPHVRVLYMRMGADGVRKRARKRGRL